MVSACVPFSSSGTGLLLTKINITITSEVTTPTPITTTHLNVNIPYTGAIPVASHSYPASTIMQLTAISTVNLNLSLTFSSGTCICMLSHHVRLSHAPAFSFFMT